VRSWWVYIISSFEKKNDNGKCFTATYLKSLS